MYTDNKLYVHSVCEAKSQLLIPRVLGHCYVIPKHLDSFEKTLGDLRKNVIAKPSNCVTPAACTASI